ncbi:MAG: hypothetical protein R3D51_00480 [Hyphomicrobiaceae bacterium]
MIGKLPGRSRAVNETAFWWYSTSQFVRILVPNHPAWIGTDVTHEALRAAAPSHAPLEALAVAALCFKSQDCFRNNVAFEYWAGIQYAGREVSPDTLVQYLYTVCEWPVYENCRGGIAVDHLGTGKPELDMSWHLLEPIFASSEKLYPKK